MAQKTQPNCDIQAADRFEFRGIGDWSVDAPERQIVVVGLLPNGALMCMLNIGQDVHQFQIPYSEAVCLVEQGIWKEMA